MPGFNRAALEITSLAFLPSGYLFPDLPGKCLRRLAQGWGTEQTQQGWSKLDSEGLNEEQDMFGAPASPSVWKNSFPSSSYSSAVHPPSP